MDPLFIQSFLFVEEANPLWIFETKELLQLKLFSQKIQDKESIPLEANVKVHSGLTKSTKRIDSSSCSFSSKRLINSSFLTPILVL